MQSAPKLHRRRFLSGVAGLAAGATHAACSSPVPGNGVNPSEIYVGLGRARQVVILDAVTDRVVGRVPLTSYGDSGAPGQITVDSSGSAAVIPLVSTGPSVGLIRQPETPPAPSKSAGQVKPAKPAASATRQTTWLRLAEERPPDQPVQSFTLPEAAQRLTADSRGCAYVVVGDGSAQSAPAVAVVDLHTGRVRRRLQVARLGEAILALHADPEGQRLYAGIWNWGDPPPGARAEARGRLVMLDAHTGAVLARAPLPDTAGVTELTTSAAPPATPSGAPVLYAVMATPGPLRDESLQMGVDRRHSVLALDLDTLDPLALWPLDRQTGALAVNPEGTRAYLLASTGASGRGSRGLLCLDLSAVGAPSALTTRTPRPMAVAPGTYGSAIREWPLPEGCFAMTLSPIGKLYVADALGDRLWRFDVQRNIMLTALSVPGAPLTVAAGPE